MTGVMPWCSDFNTTQCMQKKSGESWCQHTKNSSNTWFMLEIAIEQETMDNVVQVRSTLQLTHRSTRLGGNREIGNVQIFPCCESDSVR